MDAHRREVLIACLRRVDCGEPVDSVIRDYPEEANWLREHLIVSGALQMADRPSAEKKSRARESLLYAVAHSDPPAPVATRPRFGFAMAQAALIIVGCLGLTAGVAAASGVNLRSVAGDVVDTLVEPLPLSAGTLQDSVGLEPEERGTDDDSSDGNGHPISQSGAGSVEDDAFADSDSSDVGGPNNTSRSVPVGPLSQTNPLSNNAPDSSPPATGIDGNPPASGPPGGQDHAGQHGTQPGETDPPGQNPGPNGQPGSNGHNGPNSPGNQGDSNQQGQIDSNGNGSNSDQPNGSNGAASNSPNRGGANDQHSGGATGSNQSDGGPAGKGGSK